MICRKLLLLLLLSLLSSSSLSSSTFLSSQQWSCFSEEYRSHWHKHFLFTILLKTFWLHGIYFSVSAFCTRTCTAWRRKNCFKRSCNLLLLLMLLLYRIIFLIFSSLSNSVSPFVLTGLPSLFQNLSGFTCNSENNGQRRVMFKKRCHHAQQYAESSWHVTQHNSTAPCLHQQRRVKDWHHRLIEQH